MGESDYNSLQVKVNQRLSRGMDFLVAYTLSKNITTVDDAFGWGGAGSTSTIFSFCGFRAMPISVPI